MHPKRIMTTTIGVILIAVSISAAYFFDSISTQLMFLSPDGQVEPYMMLLLRIVLLSLGTAGLALLLSKPIVHLLSKIDAFVISIPRGQFLILLFSLALILRALALLTMPFNLWADYLSYDDLAIQWADKGGYYNGEHLTAYWPPLYPFVLSRLYLLFGHHPETGTYLNLFLALLTVLLTYLIARSVWSERVARWTALLISILPSQVLFTNLLASEMLFTPLLLLTVWLAIKIGKTHSANWPLAFISGLSLGLAILTRSIAQFIWIFIIPYWYWQSTNARRTIKNGAVLLIGLAVVVAPWMIRNHYAVGLFRVNTNTGINLYMGNQPGSGMGYNSYLASEFDVNDPTQEAYIDSVTWNRAWEYILANPVDFARRGVLKVGFFYAVDTDALDYQLLKLPPHAPVSDEYLLLALITESYWLLILLAAFPGILLFCRSGFTDIPAGWMLVVIILYWTGLHFLFYGMGRYHVPITPLLTAFAAYFIKIKIDQARLTS